MTPEAAVSKFADILAAQPWWRVRRSRLVAWVAAAAALACAAPLCAQEPADGAEAAEDSVWVAVLDTSAVPDTQYLVVRARTSKGLRDDGSMDRPLADSRPPRLERETVNDFLERNLRPRAVGPLPDTRVKIVLAVEATLDSITLRSDTSSGWTAASNPVERYWRAFRERFPHARGIMTFSRVGFNAARTQAVVNVSYSCGGLCGKGTIVLLYRDATGRWRVVRTTRMWVS